MTYRSCAASDQIPVLLVGSERRLSGDIHTQNRNNAANMLRLLCKLSSEAIILGKGWKYTRQSLVSHSSSSSFSSSSYFPRVSPVDKYKCSHVDLSPVYLQGGAKH